MTEEEFLSLPYGTKLTLVWHSSSSTADIEIVKEGDRYPPSKDKIKNARGISCLNKTNLPGWEIGSKYWFNYRALETLTFTNIVLPIIPIPYIARKPRLDNIDD